VVIGRPRGSSRAPARGWSRSPT